MTTEQEPPTADSTSPDCKSLMLDRVAKSDGHFKHQQRDEPDLQYDEKLLIAKDLLENKPVVFLSRFGKFLVAEDLAYFKPLSDQYEVNFYLKDIKKQLDDQKNHQKIRNRRFEAMKQMMMETDYFSDEEMKARNPLLYDQLVGQFLSDNEIKEQSDKQDCRISEVFLQHLQGMQNTELFERLRDIEESQREESDDDEEEEEDVEENEDMDSNGDADEMDDKEAELISQTDRKMMRREFLRTMQLRFLNGEDKDFNYSDVDNNVEYDSLDIRTHDEEEKYFDEEDSASMSSVGSVRHKTEMELVSNEEEDYEMYEVEEDVRPGLIQKVDQTNEDKEDAGDSALSDACKDSLNIDDK